ncbi:cytoglobin-like isoform X1 [Paramacrobiotus metropolitanus]|uniref:cytoglobin-like isoform X1 n=1 Tax=Paramacrobiotus metropolitanus TaxID=2943436 RepID=UPI002445C9D9|nr:cytoglobin-like isoform X1 [Paramacrobiotus metropolitanus]
MGNRASRLLSIGSVDAPDKVTGLSEIEKRAIQENWRIIYRDLKGNGVELFVRYFSRFPEFKDAFESLRDVRLQDIGKSHKLRAHSVQVMQYRSDCPDRYGPIVKKKLWSFVGNSFPGEIADNLNDPDVLVSLLMKTGRNHAKRGMRPEHFTTLHTTTVDFLAFKLGHNFGHVHKTAWNKMLEMVMNIIQQGMTAEADDNKYKENQIAASKHSDEQHMAAGEHA